MTHSQTVLDGLIPPKEMLHDGTSLQEEFVKFGESFLEQFLRIRAYLAPDQAMLDLGCGGGRAVITYFLIVAVKE